MNKETTSDQGAPTPTVQTLTPPATPGPLSLLTIERKVGVGGFWLSGVTLVYLTGYLIHSIFIRTLGIESLTLAKAQYVETGFVFWVLTLVLTVVPSLTFFLTKAYRKHLAHQKPGLAVVLQYGYRRTALVVVNFCLILTFFTCFLTSYDWYDPARVPIYKGITIAQLFYIYFWFILVGVMICGEAENLALSIKKSIVDKQWFHVKSTDDKGFAVFDEITRRVVGTIRWILLTISIAFDAVVLITLQWIPKAIYMSRWYLILLVCLFWVVYRTNLALRNALDEKMKLRLLVLAAVFLLALLELTVTAYSYSVYRFMPANRGGKMPHTETKFVVKSSVAHEILQANIPGTNDYPITVTAFIVDQTEDKYFITFKYPVFEDITEFGTVHVLKKEDIITMSFPMINVRTNR